MTVDLKKIQQLTTVLLTFEVDHATWTQPLDVVLGSTTCVKSSSVYNCTGDNFQSQMNLQVSDKSGIIKAY